MYYTTTVLVLSCRLYLSLQSLNESCIVRSPLLFSFFSHPFQSACSSPSSLQQSACPHSFVLLVFVLSFCILWTLLGSCLPVLLSLPLVFSLSLSLHLWDLAPPQSTSSTPPVTRKVHKKLQEVSPPQTHTFSPYLWASSVMQVHSVLLLHYPINLKLLKFARILYLNRI